MKVKSYSVKNIKQQKNGRDLVQLKILIKPGLLKALVPPLQVEILKALKNKPVYESSRNS